MRKSTVIFTGALWLLALINMWLLMRAGEEHARVSAARARTGPWRDAPQTGTAIFIVNAPPDFPVSTSGPPTRGTAKSAGR
jgi:hypothetical protein